MISAEELRLIGGSDVAALVGLSPYSGPFDLYSRIVDGTETAETKAMRRGTLMEPVIRAMVVEDFGLKLLGPEKHRIEDWGRANLDDRTEDEAPVELKSVGAFAGDGYGPSGTDEIPEHHGVQVQTYLWVKRASRGQLFALLGLDDLRRYYIVGDAELQEALVDTCRRFWRDHIVPRRPPPIDATQACSDWLERRFPKAGEELLDADPIAEEIAARLREAKRTREAAEETEKECRNLLSARIGAAKGIKGDGWRASFFNKKGRARTDWEAVAQLAKVPEQFIQLHTTIGAPSRELRTTFKKGSANE